MSKEYYTRGIITGMTMIMPLMTFQWAYLSIKTGNLPGLIVIGFFWTLGALAWKRYFDTIRGMNDDKD